MNSHNLSPSNLCSDNEQNKEKFEFLRTQNQKKKNEKKKKSTYHNRKNNREKYHPCISHGSDGCLFIIEKMN
jgi:hypothetical protein